MKKFLLSLACASMALSSVAATKILYQQDFENVTDPAAAGWSVSGGTMSINSDEFGKFFKFDLGKNNGRTATLKWGQNIFFNNEGNSVLEDGNYTMKYDFCIAKGSNSQYGGSITVFTNLTPIVHQPARNPWSPVGWWDSYLFDMSQVDKKPTEYVVNGGTKVTEAENGTKSYAIDYTGSKTFTAGKWYTVTLNTNVYDRTVKYSVATLDGEIIADGIRNVPETNVDGSAVSMFAEGIHMLAARYYTIIHVDNISITCESATEVSNAPVINLVGVGVDPKGVENFNYRAYEITFLAGETLHIGDANGENLAVEFDSCNGKYTYYTTTSGVFKAWTSCGSATSPIVEETADCTPVQLPEATVTMNSLGLGYKKVYAFSADNSAVLLKPTINFSYSYVPATGATIAADGNSVEVNDKGTLTVTASALGYVPSTVVVENTQNLDLKKTYDFARMTKAEIIAAGFPDNFKVLNSTDKSGFNNWTARKYIYYVDAATGKNVYPFSSEPYMEYVVVDNTEEPAGLINDNYFEGLNIFPATAKGNKNVGFINHVGLYNDQATDDYNNIVVNGLDDTDFVAFNTINGYGSNSNHPTVANADEFFAQLEGQDNVLTVAPGETSVAFPLYRIDTACTKITVYKQIGENEVPTALETLKAVVAGDNFYYTIDGKRLAQPTAPGFYIHNGQKLIIR